MDLKDKVVLITGASSGFGEATSRRLAERGARLVLGARRVDRLTALQDELGGAERVAVLQTDVTDDDQVKALVELARGSFGAIDAVFANAGFGGGGTVIDGDPEHWRAMFLTNIYGAAITIHYAAELLLEAPEPHIILTSSVAGTAVHPQRNHLYSASKFAVEAMGEGLRKELTGKAKVTLIEPGAADTEFFDWPTKVLSADDVARTIVYALEQPADVAINNIMLRPLTQEM
jgi:NADP-dependent 3-hydroxy acid dehydrogenase YdfG